MKKYKLIALDLDGTLFTDDKRLTKRTRNALYAALKSGLMLVPATGRLYKDIPHFMKSLSRYGIYSNGGLVYDSKENRILHKDLMAYSQYQALSQRIVEAGMILDIYTPDKIFRDIKNRERVRKLPIPQPIIDFMMGSRQDVENLLAFLEEKKPDILKLTVNFPKGDTDREKLAEILQDYPNFACVSGGVGNREITEKSTSKGKGLRVLAKALGLSMEETIAIGDSGNDLQMLKAAGFSIAMGNGDPEVKAIADYVTGTNEQDGAAMAIEKLLEK